MKYGREIWKAVFNINLLLSSRYYRLLFSTSCTKVFQMTCLRFFFLLPSNFGFTNVINHLFRCWMNRSYRQNLKMLENFIRCFEFLNCQTLIKCNRTQSSLSTTGVPTLRVMKMFFKNCYIFNIRVVYLIQIYEKTTFPLNFGAKFQKSGP